MDSDRSGRRGHEGGRPAGLVARDRTRISTTMLRPPPSDNQRRRRSRRSELPTPAARDRERLEVGVGAATTLPLIAAAADTENSPSPSGPPTSLNDRGQQVKGAADPTAPNQSNGQPLGGAVRKLSAASDEATEPRQPRPPPQRGSGPPEASTNEAPYTCYRPHRPMPKRESPSCTAAAVGTRAEHKQLARPVGLGPPVSDMLGLLSPAASTKIVIYRASR